MSTISFTTIFRPSGSIYLDGFRERAVVGAGNIGNDTGKDQTAGIEDVRNGGIPESNYGIYELRENQRRRIGSQLFAGGSTRKTGSFHKLDPRVDRLHDSLENVPQRDDRCLRCIS